MVYTPLLLHVTNNNIYRILTLGWHLLNSSGSKDIAQIFLVMGIFDANLDKPRILLQLA